MSVTLGLAAVINEIFSMQAKFVGLSRNNFSDQEKIYSEPSFIENHGGNEGHINFKYGKSKKVILYANTQISESKLINITQKILIWHSRIINLAKISPSFLLRNKAFLVNLSNYSRPN